MKKFRYIVLSFLMSAGIGAQAQDTLPVVKDDATIDLAYQKMDQQRFVGAADVVTSEDLMHSTHYQADMALPGLASGLYATKGSGDPGNTWATLRVRGLSRGGNDAPLYVVDGIPFRSIDNLPVEAIKSITVLKDITAKMLYGSQAANGVIVVITKRGENVGRQVSFSVEAGIKKPTFTPDYLDAGTYAQKYNESQMNDGVAATDVLYSQDDIDAYANGTKPLLYPNEDYYGTLVNNMSNFQRVNAILNGGDEKTRFFLNMEYVREKGLEAVGQGHEFNQLNLVSNLDYDVNDIISVNLDLSTRLGLHSNSRVGGSTLYNAISSDRPNEYPFFVTGDQSANTDSLAYNTTGGGNIYGDMSRGGYSDGQDFQAQTSMGMDFNLDDYVQGLSASVKLGFDSYNSIYKGKSLDYSSYRIQTDSVGDLSLLKIGEDEVKNTESKFSDNFWRNMAGYANIKYDRTFGDHAILADANFSMRRLAYKSTVSSNEVKQDNKGLNAGLRVNYAFQNKYVLQLNSSYMGSDRFTVGNQYKLYNAVGAAWVLSEEDFLKDVDAISYLKLKGSYGTMGYDMSIDYYIHANEFGSGGGVYTGTNNSTASWGKRITQFGNPDITFEESTELNIGVESRFLNNTLTLEANYFNELRDGMPTVPQSSFPSYVPYGAAIVNYNSVRNTGVDMSLNYANKAGDLYYSLGANVLYSKAVYEKYDESVLYDHQSRIGVATDAYFGLNALGLYTDADFNTDGTPTSGVISSYGNIQAGDIKYENKVEDAQIDGYDTYENGHTYPRYYYSMNINLAYKGFEFYALGQGVADVDKLLSSKYFLNYGERKYSTQVNAADYPNLTSNTTGGNNFRNSTYWKEDGAYFKLRTVELSYTLPSSISQRISAEKVKIFVRGTDLFTFSAIDTVDPEDVSAGVTKYPLFTTGSLGAKITF